MITIIGTGHVFNLAEPVSFIVKNIWPDALLIELDVSRYNALMNMQDGTVDESQEMGMSAIYRQNSRYQKKMSEEYGSEVGGEFLAAINTAKLAGAEIIPIDTNAMEVMNQMWEEMSMSERIRYRMSGLRDSLGGKRRVEQTQEAFADNEQAYVDSMRRRYPTLVRKLIDERNVYMAEQINEISKRFTNMVIVVGDAHVEGICALLAEPRIRKIRLADMLDPERMKKVRSMVWYGEEPQ